MELKVYEKEILKNYEYIKKLEEIIPLKKAEMEFKLWNTIREKLEEKFKIKAYNFIGNSSEYLLQNHVNLLSFELKNLTSSYGKNIFLGIGRYLKKDGIYFFVSDNSLNSKNKKYISFLNKLKNNENLKEWHSNNKNLYTEFKKNTDLNNILNPEYDDFYNLFEEEKFNNIVNIIVDLFCEEYKKLTSLKF